MNYTQRLHINEKRRGVLISILLIFLWGIIGGVSYAQQTAHIEKKSLEYGKRENKSYITSEQNQKEAKKDYDLEIYSSVVRREVEIENEKLKNLGYHPVISTREGMEKMYNIYSPIFSTMEEAKEFMEKLKRDGYDSKLIPLPDKEYKVRVACCYYESSADEIAKALIRLGYNHSIVRENYNLRKFVLSINGIESEKKQREIARTLQKNGYSLAPLPLEKEIDPKKEIIKSEKIVSSKEDSKDSPETLYEKETTKPLISAPQISSKRDVIRREKLLPPNEENILSTKKSFEEDNNNNLGVAYYQRGALNDALEHFNLAIQQDPNNFKGYVNLGIVYKKQNKIKNAIESYQKAIFLKPHFPESYYNLGILYDDTRDYKKAAKAYQKFLQLVPEEYQDLKQRVQARLDMIKAR